MHDLTLTVLRHGVDQDQMTVELRAIGRPSEIGTHLWRALFATFEWNAREHDHSHVERRPPAVVPRRGLREALTFARGDSKHQFVVSRHTRIPAGVGDGDQTHMREIVAYLAHCLDVPAARYQYGDGTTEEIESFLRVSVR